MSGQNRKITNANKVSSGSKATFSAPWTSYKENTDITGKEVSVTVKPNEIGKVYKNFRKWV